MQSRLTAAAVRINRQVFFGGERQFLWRRFGSTGTTSGRTADPAEHAVEPEEVDVTDAIEDERRRHRPEKGPTTDDNDPYVPPKSPIGSSSKLESPGVGPRTDPIAQHKRRNTTVTATKSADVSCTAGIDESPWPEEDRKTDRRTQREEQEKDDSEYFEHHKASPLSEIEVADTRKPMSQATDVTAQNSTVGYDGKGDNVWRPEQLDTAEESLRRAAEIFRMNAMRGDPDSPHGRVLRKLRGENW